MIRKCLLLFGILSLLIGCGGNPEFVEKELEKFLEVEIPSDFEIIKYKEGGFNDYTVAYELKFTENDFEEIIGELDVTKWESRFPGIFSKIWKIDRRTTLRISFDLNMDQHVIFYTKNSE